MSPAGLFGDPAWEIVLDLFVCRAEGRRISVSAACVGVSASSATALRYIGLLHRNGLVSRTPDPNDGRRFYVDLTARGMAVVEEVLATGLDR